MIVLNEERLSAETLESIKRDYEMKEEESVIERFYFDVDAFKDKIINIVKDSLKVRIKLV